MVEVPDDTPQFQAKSFRCPHCDRVAQQHWRGMTAEGFNRPDTDIRRSTCQLCEANSYWVTEELVSPAPHSGPPPNEDMPLELVGIYEEARSVAIQSPRAAAALIRMLIEQLVKSLDDGRGKLNDRIGRLSAAGLLSKATVNALDAVRVTGNESLHDGRIDSSGYDDRQVVGILFELANQIAEQSIAMPRKVQELIGSKAQPRNSAQSPKAG